MEKTVKYQIVGLKGDNKNVMLTKDFKVANAVDGHFETNRQTGAILEETLNLEGEPKVILREDDPEYKAPIVVAPTKGDKEAELVAVKDALVAAKADNKILKEDIESLKKDLDKAMSGGETDEVRKANETLSKEVKEKDLRIQSLEEAEKGLRGANETLSKEIAELKAQAKKDKK